MLTISIIALAQFVFRTHGTYCQVMTHETLIERHLSSNESVQRIDPIKKWRSLKIEIHVKKADKMSQKTQLLMNLS